MFCEGILGALLISGIAQPFARCGALGCVTIFGIVSLIKALSGELSCGCFGTASTNPWLTFAFNFAAFIALSYCHWEAKAACATARPTPWLGFGALLATCVTSALLLAGVFQHFSANDMGHKQVLILNPADWPGKRFALLDEIDMGDQLAHGQWLVVLFRRDCSHCLKLLERWRSGQMPVGFPEQYQVALIQLPPYRSLPASPAYSMFDMGRVSSRATWLVETPVVVRLNGALVEKAVFGDEALMAKWVDLDRSL